MVLTATSCSPLRAEDVGYPHPRHAPPRRGRGAVTTTPTRYLDEGLLRGHLRRSIVCAGRPPQPPRAQAPRRAAVRADRSRSKSSRSSSTQSPSPPSTAEPLVHVGGPRGRRDLDQPAAALRGRAHPQAPLPPGAEPPRVDVDEPLLHLGALDRDAGPVAAAPDPDLPAGGDVDGDPARVARRRAGSAGSGPRSARRAGGGRARAPPSPWRRGRATAPAPRGASPRPRTPRARPPRSRRSPRAPGRRATSRRRAPAGRSRPAGRGRPAPRTRPRRGPLHVSCAGGA